MLSEKNTSMSRKRSKKRQKKEEKSKENLEGKKVCAFS
jgi:hypothetical protein